MSNSQFTVVDTGVCRRFKQASRRFYAGGTVRAVTSQCVLPARYTQYAERIRRLHVREDDVWVISYPKCGTTWTQEMVWLLMNNLDWEGAKRSLFERSPFLEFSAVSSRKEEEGLGLDFVDTIQQVEDSTPPRCIKSHLPRDLLPLKLWTKKPKIIYVTRGVKDVLVSYYHHHRLCNGYTGSIDDFAEAFMEENVVYWDPYWKHVLDFWELRLEDHVLINMFEDMKKDLPGVIQRTAAFLQRTLTSSQMETLMSHLQFDEMRKNPAVNGGDEVDILNKAFGTDDRFLRKGIVGSGLQELRPELIAAINHWSRQRVAGTGFPGLE